MKGSKHIRKALALVMALAVSATALVGCASQPSGGSAAEGESSKTPLIGIAWRADTDSEFYVNIATSIREAGGIPVLLAEVVSSEFEYDSNGVLLNAADEQGALLTEVAEKIKADGYKKTNAAEVAAEVDAVIFTGGEDISSSLFKVPEPWHGIEAEKDYNVTRDASDYMLMDYCLDNNIPMLGVCRGMQMLAVVSGAEMIQDIPTFMASVNTEYNFEHRNNKATPESYRDFAAHDVVIKEDSIAYKFSGETLIEGAPSWHHQAVKSVEGTELAVTGTLDVNGQEMIEIIERTDKDFAIGIQYHPEAAVDKVLEPQANAGDYMEYDDAMEVFEYLVDLVD